MDLHAKGNLGVRITWLAAIAFLLCILGQTMLLGLFLALVLLVEKNDWLSYQTMEAFLLSIVSSLLGAISGALSALYSIPLIGGIVSGAFGFVFGILNLIVFVAGIVACYKASKGETMQLPVVSAVAASAFNVPAPKPVYTPAAQPTYTAPAAPAQPAYTAPAAPVQPAAPEAVQPVSPETEAPSAESQN